MCVHAIEPLCPYVLICNLFSTKKQTYRAKVGVNRLMVGALSRYLLSTILNDFSACQEERRRQLEVKLTIEEQLRLRREEEEGQERRRREEGQREMEERRKEAAKGIRRFNERVRIIVFVTWGCVLRM